MRGFFQRLPILAALLAQGAGFLALRLVTLSGLELPGFVFLAIAGGAAAVVGNLLGLARWWMPIQFFLPFILVGALTLDLPAWLYLTGFLILALIYWNAAGERVPLYLSNATTWRALEDLIRDKASPRMIDLGSGMGGTLLYLSKAKPEGRYEGVESAPLPFFGSWLRAFLGAHKNVQVRYASLWDQDLSDYDLVYCFLSPAPMTRLYEKARKEMKPGSLFVSNSFTVPDHDPDEIHELDDRRQTKLLIWRMN